MEMTNFTTPMQAVQTISMFSYLTTLSDFLVGKNLLNINNQYQPIPVVNSLYHYFLYNTGRKQKNVIEERKIRLARKLIRGTDLYGAKENEIPDPIFVDSLFRHIITTLVFEKYKNIYGFLVEIVRNSKDLEIKTINENIFTTLTEEIFLNENGEYSKLEIISIFKIQQDFIYPLFPKITTNINLLSIDYIYAQAGAMFHLSQNPSPLIVPTVYNHKDLINPSAKFNEFVTIAHAIEQLVIAGKLEIKVMAIFTLPSLFFYISTQKEVLKNVSTEKIMMNSTLGAEAYNMLFTYLNNKFEELKNAKKNDYRYQFYLARANFKNRTTLAREIIRSRCLLIKKEDLEDEVTNYKNNPDAYQCNTGIWTKKIQILADLNLLYQEEVNKITNKYFIYQKKSIIDAFGEDFIKSMNNQKVKIYRGLIDDYLEGYTVRQIQYVKKSDDFFKFYFPETNTTVFYALIRDDKKFTAIQQANDKISFTCNPSTNTSNTNDTVSVNSTPNKIVIPQCSVIQCTANDFRQKLGMPTTMIFPDYLMTSVEKEVQENFDDFIIKIAKERAGNFNKSLRNEGYDETKQEWWEDFGLSLIPFYTCVDGFQTNNDNELSSCLLDVVSMIPFIGDLELILEKFTTVTTRSLLSIAGTTFASFTLRESMRTTLEKIGEVIANEAVNFSELFTKETFKGFGISLFRYVDPGFELIYDIGRGGVRVMRNLITELRKYSLSFDSLRTMLRKCEEKILNTFTKINNKFSEMDVYVNSLSKKNSGYGYKYIEYTDERVLQIRQIEEEGNREMVVQLISGERNLCMALDMKKGKIRKKVLHVKNEHMENENSEFVINSFHDSEQCGKRIRRTPTEYLCMRNTLKDKREKIEKAALDYVREYGVLSEDVVLKELRKYVFPGTGEKQLQFVKDWREMIQNGHTGLPAWSKEYKIQDHNYFQHIIYSDSMDKKQTTYNEAYERLKSIYFQEYPATGTSVLLHTFEAQKAYESVTFEDFAAIHNYMGSGYSRMDENTIEARSMRAALYRLAIRQAEDPIKEFAKILYRGETRPQEVVDKLFQSGKELELNRFTSATTMRHIAYRFQYSSMENVKILYEMKFSEPYLRAKLEPMDRYNHERETVLLPGSKFLIDEVKIDKNNWKEMLVVKMTFLHDKFPKHKCYKKYMNELEKLKEKDATLLETHFR
ncbi:uncharacterized protein LOC127289458 [Leptopilina boulardi]|uniref:uncharacterized protein LOC127289458 n=1 Tax=Leptopilina boulardi TaxID=63433 RepID=UPI0021F66627|nr:uncharacterized protein LOC127289458 [Leptopilina boulardi]